MTRAASAAAPSVTATLAGAIIVAAVVGAGFSLTVALVGVRLHGAGYSGHAIGLNTAAGGIATLVGAPFIPWIARSLGVARLLLASLLTGALALVGFTLTGDFTAWMVLRFLVGFAVTVEFVLSEFWITTWAPPDRRGLAIGVYATSLAGGFAIGPLILAFLGTAGDAPFYFGAALFGLAAVPLALNAGAAPRLEERSAKTFLTFLRDAPAATLAAVLHGAIETACLGLLPVYAIGAGTSVAQGALFASIFVLGSGAFQVPIGAAADRADRRLVLFGLAVAGLLGAIVLALLGVAHVWVFEALLVGWGGIVGAFYPVGLGQLGAAYEGADLAGANSAFVMAYAVGMLAGPPIVGAGLDVLPPSGFFWAIAGLIALYLVVAGRGLRAAGPSA